MCTLLTKSGPTVITTLVDVPLQEFAVGVIVYVAAPEFVPEFVSVCAMLLPLLLDAPVTPFCDTVQAKVVPVTFDVKAIDGAVLLHIVCDDGVAVTFGVGFTVIVAVVVAERQPYWEVAVPVNIVFCWVVVIFVKFPFIFPVPEAEIPVKLVVLSLVQL